MSEALNIIKAHFGSPREVTTAPVWQYNYGQKLEIDGIPNLPSTFEIHYSNSKSRGTAKRWIGYNGVVDVLDEYFRSGADIWGFIFLHEGEDDGETEYVIRIPVKERSEAEDSEPTPVQKDIVDETIAALNAAVAQCGAYVEHYPTVINGEWYVWDEETEQFVTTGVAATGNGIADARLNQDYTLTLVFTDGTFFTTPISIRGATGDSGVYVGDSEPTDPNQTVWIDTNGSADSMVSDVRINGTSVVSSNVANIPVASPSAYGVTKGGRTTVSGTTPSITAQDGVQYICGEVATIDIILPDSGIVDVVFTSGSTPTVLTVTPPTGQTVRWTNGFDATSLEANTTYEVNFLNGMGVVGSWT